MRSLAALYVSLMLAVASTAAPSFDCEKAASDVEKFICQNDGPVIGNGSAWLDRQLARLYAIAKERIPTEKQASFAEAQRKFLRDRDACFTRRGCNIGDVYRTRLKDVARAMNDEKAFQIFRGAGMSRDGGELQIARYGKTAALSIWTVGGNYHVCQFEQDDLSLGEDGVVRFEDKVMPFHIVVTPVGDALQITTEGYGYCGARASMDGKYVLRK